jgi:hypothetical protein
MRGHQRQRDQHQEATAQGRDHIAEIGEILAAGLIRLKVRQSSHMSDLSGESSLACVAHQSGHRNTELERMG